MQERALLSVALDLEDLKICSVEVVEQVELLLQISLSRCLEARLAEAVDDLAERLQRLLDQEPIYRLRYGYPSWTLAEALQGTSLSNR